MRAVIVLAIFITGFVSGFIFADQLNRRLCDKALTLALVYIIDLRDNLKEMRDKYERVIGIQRYIEGFSDGRRERRKR